MQLARLHFRFDKHHQKFGDRRLAPIYGAGCTKRPRAMLIFMNPTAKNVSAARDWSGIRAPWLGTKNIWRLLRDLRLVNALAYDRIRKMTPDEWTPPFSASLYRQLADQGIYITNFIKSTQSDARALPRKTFEIGRADLELEILTLRPKKIVTFGNLVSSLLLRQSISVNRFHGNNHVILSLGDQLIPVYPTWYPVGQGLRNMTAARQRIERVLKRR